MRRVERKDPLARLNFGWDWAPWLAGDTIASSSWTVPAGLTQESSAHTATSTTVVLSGGVAGKTYQVRNQITTAAGYIDVITIYLMVQPG